MESYKLCNLQQGGKLQVYHSEDATSKARCSQPNGKGVVTKGGIFENLH
jgi:putative hemolysin